MSCTSTPKLAPLIEYLDGLDGRADLGVLSRLLEAADICREDLGNICRFCDDCYQRNTVARSDWFELVALCWKSGQCTPIHDHVGSSCAFRVVHGTGVEIQFDRTASGLICPTRTISMDPGYICAAEDETIHQVANMQPPGEDLITLHCYSPPIGSINGYALGSTEPITLDCTTNTN